MSFAFVYSIKHLHPWIRPVTLASMVCLILLLFTPVKSSAQQHGNPPVFADFSIPDTVCVNQLFTIANNSQGDSATYWRICSGNAVTNPNGIDLGNPSNTLNAPWGITLVQDGVKCLAFVTNSGDSTITRVYWENGLMKPPVAVNLGNFGVLTKSVFGIQVKNDKGNWIGFVINGTSLVRLDFGPSLLNASPLATTVVPFMDHARGLVIEKDGSDWVGFATNWPGKSITRFHWPASLTATPVVENLGNLGGLTDPMQPALIRDISGWYLFIANTTSMVQLHFANSLMDVPDALNLGNMGTMTDDRGICVFMECNNPYGLIVNHNMVKDLLLQLHFKGGLAGTKAITPLGSVANMYLPSALSEAVIIIDTIYTIALNEHSMTTLFFPPCIDTIIPWSALRDPPPIAFSKPGTYTISLTVNPGLTTEQRICKELEVDTPRYFTFGRDTTICEGTDLVLTPGDGYTSYLWNTGATTRAIQISQTGDYSVIVTNFHACTLTDTIHVDVVKNLSATIDTSICWGRKYMAEGKWQSTGGTYYDTIMMQHGCIKIVTTHLSVKPEVIVNIGKDTCVVKGNTMELHAHVVGAEDYTWTGGSHDSLLTVGSPGIYWVKVTVNKCEGLDTVQVNKCPEFFSFYLPNAFTPNGDGINDFFVPTGKNIGSFHMLIYNRWGQLLFETSDPGQGWDGTYNNEYCETGIYIYIVNYSNVDFPGEEIKNSGSFTLVR
jgi:gliding motility-associated-like protein